MAELQAYRRRIYLPAAKEASYNVGDDHGSVDFILDPLSTSQLRPDVRMFTDRLKSTGREFPLKQWPTEQSLPTQPIDAWLTHHLLGFMLGFGLGSDTISGAGANKNHSFVPVLLTGSAFPGSFGLLDFPTGPAYDAEVSFAHAGCVLDGFDLSWGREDMVAATLSVMGSGKVSTVGTVTESSKINMDVNGYFLANKTRVAIAAASGEHDSAWDGVFTASTSPGVFANAVGGWTSLSASADSFRYSWRNGFTRTRSGGMSAQAGVIGVQPRLGRSRESVLSCDLVQADDSGLTKALLAATHADNKEYALFIEFISDVQIATTGVYFCGGIVMPNCGIRAVPAHGGTMEDHQTESVEFFAKEETGASLRPVYGFVENAQATVYSQA